MPPLPPLPEEPQPSRGAAPVAGGSAAGDEATGGATVMGGMASSDGGTPMPAAGGGPAGAEMPLRPQRSEDSLSIGGSSGEPVSPGQSLLPEDPVSPGGSLRERARVNARKMVSGSPGSPSSKKS